MPATITTSPDKEDLLEALSAYYYPDGSVEYEAYHVKLLSKDKEGNEVSRLVPANKLVIQFTGTQSAVRVRDHGVLFEVEDDEDDDD